MRKGIKYRPVGNEAKRSEDDHDGNLLFDVRQDGHNPLACRNKDGHYVQIKVIKTDHSTPTLLYAKSFLIILPDETTFFSDIARHLIYKIAEFNDVSCLTKQLPYGPDLSLMASIFCYLSSLDKIS